MQKTLADLKFDSPARKAARKRNTATEARALVISFLRWRDGDACQICGELMAYDDMGIDHIIEVWRGGKHEHDNVRLAHRRCNYSRLRGSSGKDRTVKKCRRGHDFTDANIYVRPNGDRECAVCKKEKWHEFAKTRRR